MSAFKTIANKIFSGISQVAFKKQVRFFGIWIALGLMLGVPIGLASAIFLFLLDYVSNFRDSNIWLIAFLPLAGLFIGFLYNKSEARISLGNNLIFQEYFIPQKVLPFLMAPLIFGTTLLTHLVGASAGREGTAVQMGAVIADRFHAIGEKLNQHRSLFLLAGVGGGFGSLFGTPWAGAIFTIEIFRTKSSSWSAVFPALMTSFAAFYTCLWTGAPHTHYRNIAAPEFTWNVLAYLVLVGALFGLIALVYVKFHEWFTKISQVIVKQQVWRPFFGGIVLFLVFMFLGDSRYMGLGISTIQEAFTKPVLPYDFIAKLLLTAFTLGFGFKGGEVTPLFFIGATLGNVLALFIPLPMAFLAALGFIAVFSGATKTFFACAVMGVELFGFEAAFYFILVTFIAQLFSGRNGIYKDQPENRLALF